ncbi:MAG: hypothetical protein ACT4ON_09365 [Bacteroidota bacterium]
MKKLRLIYLLLLLGLNVTALKAQTAFASEEELKKQAAKLFEEEQFEEAYPLYTQLTSIYPKDPNYNYRIGVCMLYSSDDKEQPISYLEFASKKPGVDKEVFFYLGKAYHLNYRFDDAIKAYQNYKKVASGAKIEKFQVDHQIDMCKSGKKLLRNLSDLVVIDKKELNRADFFRGYDVSGIGGKLLAKPDEDQFKSALDKKKKESSIIYLSANNTQIYFSSYGTDPDRGKDIFIIKKLPTGEWSPSQTLGYPINTEYDEDFPFLHPNGKVLYFCSKGHNSMGGYDIFKTTLNEETDTWNKPVNMDFPINTPDDDILYVTNEDEKEAYFASARASSTGKTAVYHIKSDRRAIDKAIIKGVIVKNGEEKPTDVKITVKDMKDNSILGIYNSKSDGSYFISVPNGGKFLFTVEAPDFTTQTQLVDVPAQSSFTPLKQELSYEPGTDKLLVKNLFDQTGDEEGAYLEVLSLIKEKSKMDVNVNEFADNPLAENSANTSTSPANTTAVNDPKKSATLSNDDIVKIAYDDAKEAETEAAEAREQADIALNLANEKNELARSKTEESKKLTADADMVTDPSQKQTVTDRAKAATKEAELLNDATVVAFNLVKKLEKSAVTKQEEADLSLKYAKDLEAAVKAKSSTAALTQLDDQKLKLETLSQEKTSVDDISSSLKIDSDNKQRELNKTIQTSADIKQEMADNIILIGNVQADADKTKNEQLKKGLLDQIVELKQENIDKQKELEQNDLKIVRLEKEFNGIKNETELVTAVINRSKTETSETAKASVASIDKNKLEQEVNTIKTDTPTSDNPALINNQQISNTNNPVDITTTSTPVEKKADPEVFVKLNQKYSADLATAEKIENAADREEIKADVLKTWSEAINTEVEKQKQTFAIVTDPETKTALANSISDAEILSKEKQTQSNESLVKAEALKQQQATIAGNTNTSTNTNSSDIANKGINTIGDTLANSTGNTAVNIGNTAPVTTPVVDTQALVILNKKYNDDIAAAEKLENIVDRESAKAQVLKKWSQAIDTEVSKQKQEFITATDPETKTLLANSISDAQKLSEEKQTQANESLAKVETYKQENTLAVAPATTTTTEIVADTTAQGDQVASKAQFIYTASSSKEQIMQANAITRQAEDLDTRSNELKDKAETFADFKDQNELYIQAEELKKQSENKKLESAGIIAAANKTEYTTNQDQLEQFVRIAVNNTADDVAMAELMKDEAKIYFDKAQKFRSEAAIAPSYYEKETALDEAYANEMIALEKQQKANAIYKKYGNSLAVNKNAESTTTNVTPTTAINSPVSPTTTQTPATLTTTPVASNTSPADTTLSATNRVTNNSATQNPNDTLYVYSNPPLVRDSTTDNNTAIKNDVVPAKETAINNVPVVSNADVNTNTTNQSTAVVLASNEVFERKAVPVYSAAKPIPVNEKLPEGLIFKVQIGAFRNPIPQDLFTGMTPITGETTPQGFTRYTAGIFMKFSTADLVKNEIKDLGYKDAFVVAFLNGKRISMNEALTMAGIDPSTIVQSPLAPITSLTPNTNNVPVANNITQPATITPSANTEIAKAENVSALSGFFFTVQVGVYSRPVSADKLFYIQPLYFETTASGALRYNTGIYNNVPRASEAKNLAVDAGIKDAFVTAYYNGKRVSLSEAALLASQGSAVFLTDPNMNVLPTFRRTVATTTIQQPVIGNQQPIINNQQLTTNNQPTTNNQQPITTNQQPATNSPIRPDSPGAQQLIAVLAQNNAMSIDSGVVFKVQIGAFKDEVPLTIANKFLTIAGKGIKNYKDENGLTIYTIGTFRTYDDAGKVKADIAVQGIPDAFIVAYSDGKKISVEEANKLINK